jgi:6-phosphogluconolactonase (cycloisomerase 2 family)
VPPTYTVGGTVSGLAGTGLVLQNNGGADLVINGNGSFSFSPALSGNLAYSVTVRAQPANPAQNCAVGNSTGTIGTSNVTNVSISCATDTFMLGGTVSGLAGSGLVLQSGTGVEVVITSNGNYSFPTQIPSGTAFAVVVKSKPSSPSQTCTISNASGSISSAGINNVNVTCSTDSFSVGGTVTGLAGAGLKLLNSAGNELAIITNGNFVFSLPVPSGAGYSVTVSSQPSSPSQQCTVVNGAGVVGNAGVTDIALDCVNVYAVGGTVQGLAGSGLVLKNSGGDALAIGANGAFSFNMLLPVGSTYAASVGGGPAHPVQTCTIANGSGVVGTAAVTSIAVTCQTDHFAYATAFVANEVWAFTINSVTGVLTPMAGSPFAAGSGATGIAFVPSNRFAYVVDNNGGEVTEFAVDLTTGALMSIGTIAAGTGPVDIAVDPQGRFVYVSNFNSQDVSAYAIDQTSGALSAVPGSPLSIGGNPRQLTVDPAGKFLYVTNEFANTVQAYSINQTTGALLAIAGSPYAVGVSPLAIAVGPAADRAYVVNYGDNDISEFAVNPGTGALTAITGSPVAAVPSACGIAVDPFGRFAFVTNAVGTVGSLSTFTVTPSGMLAQIAGSPVPAGSSPCSAAVDPTGSFVFTANVNSQSVSGYSIDQTTGALTELPGSPFTTGIGPAQIVVR